MAARTPGLDLPKAVDVFVELRRRFEIRDLQRDVVDAGHISLRQSLRAERSNLAESHSTGGDCFVAARLAMTSARSRRVAQEAVGAVRVGEAVELALAVKIMQMRQALAEREGGL